MTPVQLFALKTLLAILATDDLEVMVCQDVFTNAWSYVVAELATGFACESDGYGKFSSEVTARQCGRKHVSRAVLFTHGKISSIHEPWIMSWVQE